MTCETHKDLEDTIAKQNDKIYQLEKKVDLLKEEIQATNLIEQNHKELNGKLRKEIDQLKLSNIKDVEDAKKEADKLMIEKIKKYEKQIIVVIPPFECFLSGSESVCHSKIVYSPKVIRSRIPDLLVYSEYYLPRLEKQQKTGKF